MKKILIFILVICCSLVFLVGCNAPVEGTIRVNEVTHSVFYAPQYLAMELGYFKEVGITLELTNGGGADKSMTALLTNSADIALLGVESVIYTNKQGHKNQPMVFGQLTKRDGSFLVGRNNEQNFDYSNLANKTVLMGRKGGMPAMTLQYVLNQKGYTDKVNINMMYINAFDMLAPTFIGGTGDYVTLFEPAASQLVNLNQGYIVNSIGKESGEVPYTAYVATKSYIKNNSVLLENFLRCINKATKYMKETNIEIVAEKLLPRFIGTSKADMIVVLKNYIDNDSWVTTPVMANDSFNRLQDIMINANELTEKVTYNDIVDNTIANKIK